MPTAKTYTITRANKTINDTSDDSVEVYDSNTNKLISETNSKNEAIIRVNYGGTYGGTGGKGGLSVVTDSKEVFEVTRQAEIDKINRENAKIEAENRANQLKYEQDLAQYNKDYSAYIQENQKNSLVYQGKPEVQARPTPRPFQGVLPERTIIETTTPKIAKDVSEVRKRKLFVEEAIKQGIIPEKDRKLANIVTSQKVSEDTNVFLNKLEEPAYVSKKVLPYTVGGTLITASPLTGPLAPVVGGFGAGIITNALTKDVGLYGISSQSDLSFKEAEKIQLESIKAQEEKMKEANIFREGAYLMSQSFANKESKEEFWYKTKEQLMQKGKSEKEASRLADLFSRQWQVEGLTQGANVLNIGTLSEKYGTILVTKAGKTYAKTGVKQLENLPKWIKPVVEKVGYKSLKTTAIPVIKPGMVEGAGGVFNYQQRKQDYNPTDIAIGGAVGGVVAPAFSYLIGTPAKQVIKLGSVPAGKAVEWVGNIIDPSELPTDKMALLFSDEFVESGKRVVTSRTKVRTPVDNNMFSKSDSSSLTEMFSESKEGNVKTQKDFFNKPPSKPQTKSKINVPTYDKSFTKNDMFSKGDKTFLKDIVPTKSDVPVTPKDFVPVPINSFIKTDTRSQAKTETRTKTDTRSQARTDARSSVFVINPKIPVVPLFFPSQKGSMKSFGSFDLKGKRKKYTPSLVAVAFNIKGKKNIIGESTGFGIRPIEEVAKKSKKKKKGVDYGLF